MHKPPLLYLCHRIPYPPNKGDKIRSFNLLKYLSRHYQVHLGCFIDDPHDRQYIATLDQWCESVKVLEVGKLRGWWQACLAMLWAKPLTLAFYQHGEMKKWVDNTIARHNINRAVVFSSAMLPYVQAHNKLEALVDYVDVDSDKWRQYAQSAPWYMAWVYRREYKLLGRYESRTAMASKRALFVSPQEARLFSEQLPEAFRGKVGHYLNGVDVDFFDPHNPAIQPLNAAIDVVFTGAMDYWANVDAVLWFSEHVWPQIRGEHPDARFYIVGGNPTPQVQKLRRLAGIEVTGRVQDVRPYIRQARVVVAPLQIARGIQNKVLEAMAMAKPVVCTSMAIEGIDTDSPYVWVEDEPKAQARQINLLLGDKQVATDSREWIVSHLKWDQTLAPIKAWIEESR